MKTTLNLSDDLMAQAMKDTGIKEKTKLIHFALNELVSQVARKRLAAMYGADKKASIAPRKRR
jgi:Arc/MetJ family transcription regulator